MTIDIWGDKPKSQVDPTTVDEEIAALIAAHEADEDAHLEVGESLQSHKASEIIDHLAGSIVTDKLIDGAVTIDKFYEDKFYYRCMFESLDQWNLTLPDSSANIDIGAGELEIMGSATTGLLTALYNEIFSTTVGFDKNPWFQAILLLSTDTDHIDFFFYLGGDYLQTAGSACFGFYWDGSAGKLYARHSDSHTFTDTEIVGDWRDQNIEVRAEMYDDGETIKYYINDVLVATHSSAGCYVDSNIVFNIGQKPTSDSYDGVPIYVRVCIFSQDN